MSVVAISRGTTAICAGVFVMQHCAMEILSRRWPVAGPQRYRPACYSRRHRRRPTADLDASRCAQRLRQKTFMDGHQLPRMTPRLDSTNSGTRSRYTPVDHTCGIPTTNLLVRITQRASSKVIRRNG